jgi:putative membrane protein
MHLQERFGIRIASARSTEVHMHRRITTMIGAAILGCGAIAIAQTPAEPATSTAKTTSQATAKTGHSADHAFVQEAAMGGMAEVDLGQLAKEKATNEKVKAFADRMVTDHSKANDELKSLAASKQITLPAAIGSKHQATHDRLAKLSGAAFDRAYVRDMLTDHQKDVAAFMRESNSGQDSDVKAWSTKTLPTLQDHLKMVQDLQKEITATRATH